MSDPAAPVVPVVPPVPVAPPAPAAPPVVTPELAAALDRANALRAQVEEALAAPGEREMRALLRAALEVDSAAAFFSPGYAYDEGFVARHRPAPGLLADFEGCDSDLLDSFGPEYRAPARFDYDEHVHGAREALLACGAAGEGLEDYIAQASREVGEGAPAVSEMQAAVCAGVGRPGGERAEAATGDSGSEE